MFSVDYWIHLLDADVEFKKKIKIIDFSIEIPVCVCAISEWE